MRGCYGACVAGAADPLCLWLRRGRDGLLGSPAFLGGGEVSWGGAEWGFVVTSLRCEESRAIKGREKHSTLLGYYGGVYSTLLGT